MNEKVVLVTPDVIEECLSESLDVLEKNSLSNRHSKTLKTIKLAS